jgi:hypothetical protein
LHPKEEDLNSSRTKVEREIDCISKSDVITAMNLIERFAQPKWRENRAKGRGHLRDKLDAALDGKIDSNLRGLIMSSGRLPQILQIEKNPRRRGCPNGKKTFSFVVRTGKQGMPQWRKEFLEHFVDFKEGDV